MNIEKERKYLVKYLPEIKEPNIWTIQQGYLMISDKRYLRVRIEENTSVSISNSSICYKEISSRDSKKEYEYDIPLTDARKLMKSSEIKLNKTRYYIVYSEGYEVDIDVYEDGSIIAEIELINQNKEFPKVLPDYIGEEVTDNDFYSNISIAKRISSLQKIKTEKIRFKNIPCPHCIFLGHYDIEYGDNNKFDLFYCPNDIPTVIAGFSHEEYGENYYSGLEFTDTNTLLKEAENRATKLGLIK